MNWYDAMEEAYKKGYAKGQEDARKPGLWEPHPNHPGFDRCSVCHDCIIADDWAGSKWKFCPECGAKMDGETVTEGHA